MLKIGDFSKLSRVSIRMLRHYDDIGLIHPAHTDPFTGYRYYRADQLPVIGRITALKEMGFSLSEVGLLLAEPESSDLPERMLLRKQAELKAEAERTAYKQLLLESALKHLRKEVTAMKFDINLKVFPERRAASVRAVIPSYEHEGMLWGTLMEETACLKMTDDNPCYCCAVFHDTEYREADVDVEVYKTVRGEYPDTQHVRFRTMPELTAATTVVRGSYALMDEANAAVGSWIADNGYALDGPMFNIYHVSPHETQNPDEFVTEVCYPVKKL